MPRTADDVRTNPVAGDVVQSPFRADEEYHVTFCGEAGHQCVVECKCVITDKANPLSAVGCLMQMPLRKWKPAMSTATVLHIAEAPDA